MAEIKPQTYKDPRPATTFDRYHERSRNHEPDWVYGFVRIVTTPISLLVYRSRAIARDHVPASGPVILASNHFSNFDHFLVGGWLRRRVRFLGKSQLFGKSAVMSYIYSHGGVIPVRRGHGDEEAFVTMHTILRRGGCLLIYCEGGRSRTGKLGEPRPGVGRMALESGAPVVPIAIHGSQGIRRWRRLIFPKVTIHFGEPMSFDVVAAPTREQQAETASEIFAVVRGMYEELARDGRRSVIKRVREQHRGSGSGGRPSYS